MFSRADKATVLFAGLLLTFISTALLVGLDDSDESETDVLLKCLYRQVLSQVLLPVLPFKHVLPYMIAKVNTVTTNTHTGVGLLKRQLNKIQQVFRCGSGKKRRHKKDVQVAAIDKWLGLVATTRERVIERCNRRMGETEEVAETAKYEHPGRS